MDYIVQATDYPIEDPPSLIQTIRIREEPLLNSTIVKRFEKGMTDVPTMMPFGADSALLLRMR